MLGDTDTHTYQTANYNIVMALHTYINHAHCVAITH